MKLDSRPLTLAILSVGVLSAAVGVWAQSTDSERPTPARRADFECVGEALADCLARLGEAYQVRLVAGKGLSEQRITLYTRRTDLVTIRRSLEQLLSAPPDGPVSWRRISGKHGYRIEESHKRRLLAQQLRALDDRAFTQHLRRELEWLEDRGRQEIDNAPDGPRRMLLEDRYAFALLARELGGEGLSRLNSGQPVVYRVGERPGELGDRFRSWLGARVPPIGQVPDSWLNGYHVVLLRERHGLQAGAGGISVAWVTPKGIVRQRSSRLRPRLKAQRRPPKWSDFRFSDAAGLGKDRRVSVWLARDPDAQPGETVVRTLDDLLKTVATQCGLNVIADGYLRPAVRMPANVEVRDLPLDRLLDGLTWPWNCDWEFLDDDKTTVLVRARFWWIEDDADVSDAVLKRLRPVLGLDANPTLDDLTELAQLRETQLRKLVETEICPTAKSLLNPVAADGVGALPWLRFYGRLSAGQRAKVRSRKGLSLSQVAPRLMTSVLLSSLMSDVGAVTPELRKNLVFQIRPIADPPGGKPTTGWQLLVRGPTKFGPTFVQWIGPRTSARVLFKQ